MNKETHQLQKLNSSSIEHKNDEYYTPVEVVKKIEELIKGNFVYDPASTEWNAQRLGIASFDTIETNGLNQDWLMKGANGDIWINPPFTLKKQFIDKAVETILAGFKGRICILTPDKSTTNKHMENISKVRHSQITPNGRVNFIDKNLKQTKGNFFGSVVIVLNEHVEYQEEGRPKQIGSIRVNI